MPAREINLNPFKDYIIAWFDDGMSSEEITERLANNHNIVCTNRTIKWRLLRTGVVLYGPALCLTGPTRASCGPLRPNDRLGLFGPVT